MALGLNMRRMKYLFLLLSVFLLIPSAPTLARNNSVVALKPVMIIRFNQPLVSFERQLALVIEQAQSAKSGVKYDLIQYIPKITSTGAARQYDQHKVNVLTQFAANGVQENQLRFGRSSSPDVETDEIYIFVR